MIALHRLFARIDETLQGWPDTVLTVMMLLAALILIIGAFKASPKVKAGMVAYAWLP